MPLLPNLLCVFAHFALIGGEFQSRKSETLRHTVKSLKEGKKFIFLFNSFCLWVYSEQNDNKIDGIVVLDCWFKSSMKKGFDERGMGGVS